MNKSDKDSPRSSSPPDLGPFQRDPWYFQKTYFASLLIFFALDFFLLESGWARPFDFSFSPLHLILIPPACYLGGFSVITIHNAAHRQFQPDWLSRVMGEIAGTHQLYGFLGWRTAHILHHCYPDDPEKDPHPPLHRSYGEYARKMIILLGDKLTDTYFSLWGEHYLYKFAWSVNGFCGFWGVVARLFFWYLFLTPAGFFFFCIPSYLFSFFIGSHLNYYTHRPGKEDPSRFDILNLNHNLYYKLANTLFFGFYYHKNHHLQPGLFNPKAFNPTDFTP